MRGVAGLRPEGRGGRGGAGPNGGDEAARCRERGNSLVRVKGWASRGEARRRRQTRDE